MRRVRGWVWAGCHLGRGTAGDDDVVPPRPLREVVRTILEELDLGGGMPSIAFRRREVLTCGADGRGVKRAGGGRREAGRGGVFDAWASVRAGRDRE